MSRLNNETMRILIAEIISGRYRTGEKLPKEMI